MYSLFLYKEPIPLSGMGSMLKCAYLFNYADDLFKPIIH